jgi:hypothetical protein
LKLAEYDFSIEHKAGKKHLNADCLSRHITSVTTMRDRKPLEDELSSGLSREIVLAARQDDAYCKELKSKIQIGYESDYIS